MEVITIESEAYKTLMSKIECLLEKLSGKENNSEGKLLTNAEALKVLQISSKTLFNYRSNGLAYIKVGKKIYYRKEDIDRYLEQNYNEAF